MIYPRTADIKFECCDFTLNLYHFFRKQKREKFI